MNILILNTHSVLNSGDAAIVLGQIGLLRELFGDPRIVATSRTPRRDRGFYERLGVDVLPPVFQTPSVFGSPVRGFAGCARGAVSVSGKRRLFAEVRRADVVISSGGGYFFSTRRALPGPMFWQAYAHVAMALRVGQPVVFAPQSFGPFRNRAAAAALRRLLSHRDARRVLAREEVSLELLHRLLGAAARDRIALCPDLAFLFEPPEPRPDEPAVPRVPRPVLAVTARDWLFPDRPHSQRVAARQGYLGALAAACAEFHRRSNGSIVVFAQARGPGRLEDDRPISRELVAALHDTVPASHVAFAELPDDAPPERIVSVIRTADAVLASRFHSAILAMLAGRPAVALGYQPKSIGMMKMLGLERYCLPMDDLDAGRLLPLLDEVLQDPTRFAAEKIRPAVAGMRRTIRLTMRDTLAPFAKPHTGHEDPARQ
jgi:colanic acid/amylovoran biosynthesis protein